VLNNLPIGVYLSGESPIHRLRARTKLLLLIWLAGLFFVANHKVFHFGTYITAFALLALAILLGGVPLGYLWRRMRLLILLLALGVPFSLAWTPGDTWHIFGPWPIDVHTLWFAFAFPVGPIIVTYDGIWYTLSFTSIFLLLYLGSMTLTLTTTPVALAEGMVLLLRPLRRFGLPSDEFGLMTLVSLRFIPLLIQEAEQLIKSQISRGADFTTGSIPSRIRGISTLLVPMVQGALRRAENLSVALEARGYGVTGQATMLHEGRLRIWDWLALLAVPAFTAAVFLFT
jgi:energy-coupling factor transport system permease protein